MDVDIYGHVNNVQYLSFFDTAVNGWYISNRLLDPAHSEQLFLVAETSCHYFSELLFPGIVTAGLRIEKLGQSSIIFRVGLFSGEADSTAAHGRFVHIHVDRETHRPVPISNRTRVVLNQLTS
ncbi:MAG: thioesterase family protein [Roseibium sp.]